jgi:HPt (histidine-containing phosphotransfer) domain-containing protein
MINIQKLAEQLEFDVEDVHELLEMFIDSAIDSIEDIKQSFANQDITGIRNGAHAIKGSAGNLLLNEVYLVAQRLEKSATEGRTMNLLGEYRELAHLIEQMHEEFGKNVYA